MPERQRSSFRAGRVKPEVYIWRLMSCRVCSWAMACRPSESIPEQHAAPSLRRCLAPASQKISRCYSTVVVKCVLKQ